MGTVALILMIVYVTFTLAMAVRLVRDWSHLKGRELLADLDDESKKIEELAGAKARLMRDIKELEFDHQMGHLSDEDYKQLRSRLERKTIRVMKKLDALRGETDFDAQIDQGLDQRYGIVFEEGAAEAGGAPERAVEAPVAPVTTSAPAAPAVSAPSAPVASAATSSEPDEGGTPCPGCGWSMEGDAAFCSQCGTALSVECGACGASMEADARFCSQCGTPAAAVAEAKAEAAPSSAGELG